MSQTNKRHKLFSANESEEGRLISSVSQAHRLVIFRRAHPAVISDTIDSPNHRKSGQFRLATKLQSPTVIYGAGHRSLHGPNFFVIFRACS
jgi:hypothetical protein